MRANGTTGCMTRVVVDGDLDLEVAELHAVMQRIRNSLNRIPESQRMYVGNALLNLAICRMLRETGNQRTATVLIRLVDAVLEHEHPPPPEAPIDLLRTHS